MQMFRFLMNKRERDRADARLADALELRQRLAGMSPRERSKMLALKLQALRFLRRGALVDTMALASLALVCIILAFAGSFGLPFDPMARLVLLVLLAFPAYRLVNVMDVSQRAYFAMRHEIEAILASGIPEPSRFDGW